MLPPGPKAFPSRFAAWPPWPFLQGRFALEVEREAERYRLRRRGPCGKYALDFATPGTPKHAARHRPFRLPARLPERLRARGRAARPTPHRPGARRARATYTAGVVCAKVARYAERQHHPERLAQPLRRVGRKGEGIAAFAPISWDAALDEVAEALTRAAQRHGSETVWPYYYAGTMGLVQRDGINRLRHAMRYSREHLDDLRALCRCRLARRGRRASAASTRARSPKSDLIVVWGGNPVSTQVNVMTHIATARKERGAKLVVVDPYRTATAEAGRHASGAAARHRRRARLRRHARAVQGGLRRPRLSGALHRRSRPSSRRISRRRTPAWAGAITGLPEAGDRRVRPALRPHQAQLHPASATASRGSRNGAAQRPAVTCLPAVTGAWRI